MLSALFGHDYALSDTTHVRLGYAPRDYTSFGGAAQEAAISRLDGGIHYRTAIETTLVDCAHLLARSSPTLRTLSWRLTRWVKPTPARWLTIATYVILWDEIARFPDVGEDFV